MSSSSFGVSVEEQVDIYNCMDLYVQYANCEGFGLPVPEAAACGVPIAGTDYSAIHDTVKNTGGYAIPVAKMYKDMSLTAERAYPENEAFAKVMLEHFSKSDSELKELSDKTIRMVNERYNWDRTAQVWMDYFDNYKPKTTEGQWGRPARFKKQLPAQIPNITQHYDFVKWIYDEVWEEPSDFYKYYATKTVRDLNFGANMDYGSLEAVNRDMILNIFNNKITNYNNIERIRAGMVESNAKTFYVKGTK